MNQQQMFGSAIWVCAGKYQEATAAKPDENGVPHFPVLVRKFDVSAVTKATLRVVGLGFFHAYINGTEVTEDQFLPWSTDYEERDNWPTDEKLTGHRLLVPEYDVTKLLKEGENELRVHFGGGWYTFDLERYGDPKAIYQLKLETSMTETELVSSEEDDITDSPVKTYYFTKFEDQDYSEGSLWQQKIIGKAKAAKPLSTEYLLTDCPADRPIEKLPVTFVSEDDGIRVYDCGVNMSGYPVLSVPAGEKVEVLFSEELDEEKCLHPKYKFYQQFTVQAGQEDLNMVAPLFTWFGFRYLSVEGNATVEYVQKVHCNVKVTSDFDSGSETLNWMYKTYLNTQLCNMHAGIPSDCPHIERRGYTGDGELTAHAVMDLLDAEKFYAKWIGDISDCQDLLSGHVQYTAPYTRCGGGPGAWGCAIVEVPYQYYKHYGDIEPARTLYDQMWRYFDYLEDHSVNLLVASDKQGEWCLGDWCTPDPVALPAPFINNYYYIRSLMRVREICQLIGREKDLELIDARIKTRKAATQAAYFNTWDGNFIGGIQGANAFAVDIGLGDERTYQNILKYYTKKRGLDTGICGTDVLIRVLFEHGDGVLATLLLLSDTTSSFEMWRKLGATTFWEYFPGSQIDRSHSHPMFGAAVAYLFDFLLGIRQEEGEAGYTNIVIKPEFNFKLLTALKYLSGKRTLPAGEIEVAYEATGLGTEADITVPEGLEAVFIYQGQSLKLQPGHNHFSFVEE